MKTCSKCKVAKQLTEFYKKVSNADGLNSQCKSCVNSSNRQYVINNLEKVNACKKRWAQQNPEKIRLVKKNWRNLNKEKETERLKIRYFLNKNKMLEHSRKYRERHRELLRRKQIVWRKENQEKAKETNIRHKRHASQTLSDSYVKSLLIAGSNIKRNDIHVELITLKRAHLQLTRKLKAMEQQA